MVVHAPSHFSRLYGLFGRLVHDLRSKEVFVVLEDAGIALAQWIVVIHAGTERGNHIIRVECRAIGEHHTLPEGAGPLGCVGIANTFFS